MSGGQLKVIWKEKKNGHVSPPRRSAGKSWTHVRRKRFRAFRDCFILASHKKGDLQVTLEKEMYADEVAQAQFESTLAMGCATELT